MIAKQLGDRIKELRKETGLSQEKFALKIDLRGKNDLVMKTGIK